MQSCPEILRPPSHSPWSPGRSGGKAASGSRIGKVWIDSLHLRSRPSTKSSAWWTLARAATVFTPNVDHVVQVEQILRFAPRTTKRACASSTVNRSFGRRISWDRPSREISGSDLLLPLMHCAERRQFRVYLLGGAPDVAPLAAKKLQQAIRSFHSWGSMRRTSAPTGGGRRGSGVESHSEARPDIVLVALARPNKSSSSHGAIASLRPAVAIGVGAGFDFVAGRLRRAPLDVRAAVSNGSSAWPKSRGAWRSRYLSKTPVSRHSYRTTALAQERADHRSRSPIAVTAR